MYPIEKYRYYFDDKGNVYAVSTYAGQTVRGKASCSPNDSFDLEKGKQLAALRCALKIANKRLKRADQKKYEAEVLLAKAEYRCEDMEDYFSDALAQRHEIMDAMKELLKYM